jgi:Flp pilus assembly protein TadG
VAEEALGVDTVNAPAPNRRPRPRALLRLFCRDQRGQALVEFVMVALPLFLIILGGIDFGAVFKNVISMRQAVSSAGRQAAVGSLGSSSTCTNNNITLTNVVPANGDANPVTNGDRYLMCTVHSQDGIGDANARVMIIVGDSSHSGTNNYSANLPITICEEYALTSLSGMLQTLLNGHFVTTTSTQLVATKDTGSDGGLTSAQETALPGSSWSFCTPPAPVS